MKYYLMTLGCPKNTVDGEAMAMLLGQAGYGGTARAEDADVLIVNTCGFLAAAEDESLAALRQLADAKLPGQLLIAAGCMAQRSGGRIRREVPGVDGLLGTRRWMEIVTLVGQIRDGAAARPFGSLALLGDPEPVEADGNGVARSGPGGGGAMPRPPVTGGSAYLKISDGCDAPCAFCSIPAIKGPLHSRPEAALVAEAQALAQLGAKEIILIAQDTTAYGSDLGRPDGLSGLIKAILASVPELRWLRLMYAYPGRVSPLLIETMAADPRICHYLDMPLQHGHPATLRRMRRPSNLAQIKGTLEALRKAMPDMALRSTFIVGLPGEDETEFAALLQYLDQIQFDRVGVFEFSPEPGTAAADMPGQVAPGEKAERFRRAMTAQQAILWRRNQLQVGRVLDVLVEGTGKMQGRRGPVALARSYRDAPEVDGLVLVPGTLAVGTMVRVRITGALQYDLTGEQIRANEVPISVANQSAAGGAPK